MRKAVRTIVVKDDQLLVMNRNKFGRIYFALVGGGVEPGETTEQAALRELKEETGLEVKNPRLVYIEDAGPVFGTQYIYLCDYVSGEPSLPADSIEAKIAAAGKNLYVPAWLPISDLPKTAFLSEALKNRLINDLEHGFPTEPMQFQSNAEIGYTDKT